MSANALFKKYWYLNILNMGFFLNYYQVVVQKINNVSTILLLEKIKILK